MLDVAAHLSVGWHYSKFNLSWQLMKNAGNLDKVSAHYVQELTQAVQELTKAGGPKIAAELGANADCRFKPPGLGFAAPLTDLVIHRRDMFLPLGITYDTDPDVVRLVLDKAVAKGMFGMVNSHKRLRGLSFRATDFDWQHGHGQEISGPGLALAHAMWGRPQSLEELSGSGLDTLRGNLAS